jgi:hypothetical protein
VLSSKTGEEVTVKLISRSVAGGGKSGDSAEEVVVSPQNAWQVFSRALGTGNSINTSPRNSINTSQVVVVNHSGANDAPTTLAGNHLDFALPRVSALSLNPNAIGQNMSIKRTSALLSSNQTALLNSSKTVRVVITPDGASASEGDEISGTVDAKESRQSPVSEPAKSKPEISAGAESNPRKASATLVFLSCFTVTGILLLAGLLRCIWSGPPALIEAADDLGAKTKNNFASEIRRESASLLAESGDDSVESDRALAHKKASLSVRVPDLSNGRTGFPHLYREGGTNAAWSSQSKPRR